MDIWLLTAKILVSLVAIATALGGALADLIIPATAKPHMRNPRWPPHARFHNIKYSDSANSVDDRPNHRTS